MFFVNEGGGKSRVEKQHILGGAWRFGNGQSAYLGASSYFVFYFRDRGKEFCLILQIIFPFLYNIFLFKESKSLKKSYFTRLSAQLYLQKDKRKKLST